MTDSNANTSGLEVVCLNGLLHQAWERLHRSDADVPGALVVLNALHVALEEPLVTAASAQAAIDAEKARADRLAKALERIERSKSRTYGHLQSIARAALQQETQP